YAIDRDDLSRVYVSALGERPAPPAPALVGEGSGTWQMVGAGAGSLFFEHRPKKDGLGLVLAWGVDAAGRPAARPQTLTPAPEARADLDAVWLGGHAVVAWTHQAPGRPAKVQLVAVDADGRPLGAPSSPLVGGGDQAFVGLAAPPAASPGHGRVLVAWEDSASRPAQGRAVQLASFGPDLVRPAGNAVLRFGVTDDSVPALAASPDGFAALTVAPTCTPRESECDKAQLDAAYLRFDPDLRVLASAPLLPQPLGGDPVPMAWGLTCDAGPCLTLSASEGLTASAFVSRLHERQAGWAPAAVRRNDAEPPFALAADTLLRGPKPLEVVSARVGGRPLALALVRNADAKGAKAPAAGPPNALASLRIFTPEPLALPTVGAPSSPAGAGANAAGASAAGGAAAGGVATSAGGGASPAKAAGGAATPTKPAGGAPAKGPGGAAAAAKTAGPAPLTEKALASSSLALSASLKGDAACAAFVVREGADSHLALAKLGPEGTRLRQASLAQAPGDVGDVDLSATPEGWLVAWVDGRDRNGEVYAARVDAELKRVSPERRLTQSPGDATEVAVLARGDYALVAYAEPKGAAPGSPANPYVVRVKASDLSPLGEPTRLSATSRHLRGLRLVPQGDEAIALWIEEPDASGGASAPGGGATLHWVRVGADGAPKGLPQAVTGFHDASLGSLAFACDRASCRGLATRAEGRGRVLVGFSWLPGANRVEAMHDLLALYGEGAARDATPAFAGDEVWVVDDEGNEGGALRRALVRW
ncbi:MAG TPA: hypothetical protein VFS00_03915, partial [Polyangiaceae bacterium]|nr:hypothetical protein [Polyangiaceae bacterium]